jgi:hypothetical protein
MTVGPSNTSRILWLIMGGLLAWGILLAVGTIVYPGRLAVYRAALIFGCTLAFVAFWGLMLLVRSWKTGRPADEIKFPPPGA